MRTKGIEIIIAILLGILIPSLIIQLLQDRVLPENTPEEHSESSEIKLPIDHTITVELDNGANETMSLDQYVLSVVLSEMPANFELEALKAQAVVARTYALRRSRKGGKHTVAAVCAQSSCCQGFCSVADYLERGGKESDVQKIWNAVEATSGLVLVYDGALIDATYFSCSGGTTEDALAVWGRDVPYLQSVVSPGEEQATHYVDTVTFDGGEFATLLGLDEKTIKIGEITYTNGGGVASVAICKKNFTGTQLRKLLKLRSTAFYITVLGNRVTITTKGFGHRVGMSQYGADAMAVNGASFEQILSHYYKDTELISFDFD